MAPWLAMALPVVGNIISNLIGAKAQSVHNMNLAQYQNRYNDPASQMNRFRQAGLNPNLIYTQGSAGNMSPIAPADYGSAFANVGSQYLQAGQTEAQTDLITQKTFESQTKQGVMAAQKEVLQANPYLRKEYIDALIRQVEAASVLKKQEADFMTGWTQTSTEEGQMIQRRGFAKMQAELDLLMQKFNLGTADQKIKAEVLASQQFQNAFNDVLNKFRVDGEVGPQQFWALLLMALGKFK